MKSLRKQNKGPFGKNYVQNNPNYAVGDENTHLFVLKLPLFAKFEYNSELLKNI